MHCSHTIMAEQRLEVNIEVAIHKKIRNYTNVERKISIHTLLYKIDS